MKTNNVKVSPIVNQLMLPSDYKFDPCDYGFFKASSQWTHHPIMCFLPNECYIKITAGTDNCFWYQCAFKLLRNEDRDQRWEFLSGSYNIVGIDNNPPTRDYIGTITSHEFAQLLLIHLFGTLNNEGTRKYGLERLVNHI